MTYSVLKVPLNPNQPTIMAAVVVCRWLAVIRDVELMRVLHHQRQHRIEPVASRSVLLFGVLR